MTVLRPFRGCRYDPAALDGGLAAVLCPPYDMIGPELKARLQSRSPYNAVHLEGGEQPDPVNPEAGYRQAAALFAEWLAAGILRPETESCFYLMRHSYRFQGQERSQLGLFGAVLVEDYGSGSVLPHEFTREPAVQDRVALLSAAKTQFSPLLTLYRDADRELSPLWQRGNGRPAGIGNAAHPGMQYRRGSPVADCRPAHAAAHNRLFCKPAGLSGRRPSPLRSGLALPPVASGRRRGIRFGRRL